MVITKRQEWIDCLKLLAIIGVIVDHTNGFLYTNQLIAYASYFSVTVFVFLGGYTAYESNLRQIKKGVSWWKDVQRKLRNFLVPYTIATGCYLFVETGVLDFRIYLSSLFNFTASAPFYFVVFYMQLIVVSRLFASCILLNQRKKYTVIWDIGYCMICLILSAIFIRYTYILPVHGGGQYLFGGTYLFVYFLGMLFAARYKNWNKLGGGELFTSINFVGMGLWFYFISQNRFQLDVQIKLWGNGFNPPSISLIVYAGLIVMSVWGLDMIVEKYQLNVVKQLRHIISFGGRYTLYIFLYHLLIINILQESSLELYLTNIWMKRIVYFSAAVFIPIGIGYFSQVIGKKIKESFFKIQGVIEKS